MGRITMPPRQRSPTDGQANFYINNCGDLQLLQPFRATGAASPFGQDRVCAELKSAVEKGLSKAGLMLFMRLDQTAVVRREIRDDDKKSRWSRSV
jgi:hypothetical protein